MENAIIVDLDNCLFDSRELVKTIPADRYNKKAWEEHQKGYKDVTYNYSVLSLILALRCMDVHIIFITSREGNNEAVDMTLDKLHEVFDKDDDKIHLLMRPIGDLRASSEVKQDILENAVLPEFEVFMAFDDLDENLEMYRKNGIDTFKFEFGDSVDG